MSDTTLREALHDAALAGLGSVNDVQLANLSDRASGRTPPPAASRGGGRRRWVVGGLAVAAVAALVAVGITQALRPVEVTPASGPGSLPDQIFPTREHILTLEQAPIGRVSMVFATSSLTGDAAPAWIAVGADSDEYRWVAPVDPGDPNAVYAWSTLVEVSPDGEFVAVAYSGDDGSLLHVEVIDASTGVVEDVMLGETLARLGGEIEGLRWSPSGRRLVVESAVVIERTSETGRRWEQRLFMVDGLTDEDGDTAAYATVQGIRPEGGDDLVGWSGESPVVVSTEREGGKGELLAVGGTVTDRIGHVDQVSGRTSAHSLSPDGSLLAALSDPTGGSSGDGRPWRLEVFDTASGDLVWKNRDVPEDLSALVGWRDARTPVLYTAAPGSGRDTPPDIEVAEYPQVAAEAVRVVGLGGDDGDYWVQNVALAADVLASGEVRAAEPPDQPWYDPRTLRPTIRDWITDHKAVSVLGLILLMGIVGIVGIGVIRRRRAHRVA